MGVMGEPGQITLSVSVMVVRTNEEDDIVLVKSNCCNSNEGKEPAVQPKRSPKTLSGRWP